MNRLAVGSIFAGILAFAGAARAQSNNPYGHMLEVTNQAQQNLFSEMNHQWALKRTNETAYRNGRPAAPPPPAAHTTIAATDFVPMVAGHPLIDQYVAGLPLAPAQRAGLRQTIIQLWNAVEAKTRRNNLASSLGVAVAVSMLVLTGKDTEDAQLAEQIASINDLLAVSPLWLGMAHAQKQQISESLLLTTSVMLLYAQAGQTDPTSKQASATIARDLLGRLGIAPPPPTP